MIDQEDPILPHETDRWWAMNGQAIRHERLTPLSSVCTIAPLACLPLLASLRLHPQ